MKTELVEIKSNAIIKKENLRKNALFLLSINSIITPKFNKYQM